MDEILCECGHGPETHTDGGYCSVEVDGGFCGCDRMLPLLTSEVAEAEPEEAKETL